MIINGYDTTVGKQYKAADQVENTIKTLALTNRLNTTPVKGILYLDNSLEVNVPVLAFPITTKGFNGETITVYDERPYRNKSNTVTNSNELQISRVCSQLQQIVATEGNSIINTNRQLMVKAFTDSLTNKLALRGGLDPQEQLTLKILIAYYYTTIMLTDYTAHDTVATNVFRSIYGTDNSVIFGVINDLPVCKGINDLLKIIHGNPTLFKLKNLDLKDLIAVVSSITFSALGGRIVAAASEAPILFASLMWGVASFKAYNRTTLGQVLEPKYNRTNLPSFLTSINYKVDLNY